MLPRSCVALKRAMKQKLQQKARGSVAGVRGSSVAGGGVRRAGGSGGAGDISRRSSTSRGGTDILAHLQELKAKEKQVLGRGSGASAAEEAPRMSKRDEQQAIEYRAQVNQKMAKVRETAIDLGVQKQCMVAFEQKLAAGSLREQDALELERVNGVRTLIGLPPLPPPPPPPPTSTHGVRQPSSRPGTPMYAGSPVNLPSPHPTGARSAAGMRQHRSESRGRAPAPLVTSSSNRADDGDDDEVQDMDLEDGELSEDGELAE
ncbi:hypothetical protein FBU59_001253 [Linderina macrospora]|uniref:Uncharacterized protein n=1 Tax=Linderina macrospora TaxID=4868 RepID=A0ACC1JEI5_9FUNG|nr:hypothetical protein FBU59_001253 [Linderina macrospora]